MAFISGYPPLLQSPFLQTFGKICFQYGLKWRYEFNNSKSGVVTFSETKSIHSELMHNILLLYDASIAEY